MNLYKNGYLNCCASRKTAKILDNFKNKNLNNIGSIKNLLKESIVNFLCK